MYDYQEKIKAFLRTNFQPIDPQLANFKLSTDSLLSFLWNAFPKDCISDYQLVEILEELGYEQQLYVCEQTEEYFDGKSKKERKRVKKSLKLGWCLLSNIDLDINE